MLWSALQSHFDRRERLAVGLMVGTSLDGVDAALVALPEDAGQMPRFVGAHTQPFEHASFDLLRAIAEDDAVRASDLAAQASALASDLAATVRAVCIGQGVDVARLSFVAAHGVTVSHRPAGAWPHSWQLLDAERLATELDTLVISEFRSSDVALGGQGAPLAPICDQRLRTHLTRDRIILNLGGIANATLLPAGATSVNDVIAADVGPANMPLDLLWRRARQEAFDRDGEVAASGQADQILLADLLQQNWLRQPLPRSFGREQFGAAWLDEFEAASKGLSLADQLATLIALNCAALRIFLDECAPRWRRAADAPMELLVTGGGRHNLAMMAELERVMPDASVDGIEAIGEDADSKEAFDFAGLGWLRVCHERAGCDAYTGSRAAAVLGSMHFPDAGALR